MEINNIPKSVMVNDKTIPQCCRNLLKAHSLYKHERKIPDAIKHVEIAIDLFNQLSLDEIEQLNKVLMIDEECYVGAKPILSQLYYIAGEIYSVAGDYEKSLQYYKRFQYYANFICSDFDMPVGVLSFRKFNQYSLSDLINNEITVSSPTVMNDPFDSLINVWADADFQHDICNEPTHLTALKESYECYRIRSFSMYSKSMVQNVLMWSHYADEHKGYCIKYRLSDKIINHNSEESYEYSSLKRIRYVEKTKNPVNIETKTIGSDLAFASKHRLWEYEREVRLINYNPNIEGAHYSIPLDSNSYVEAIYFGYRCPDSTINTIKNLFKGKHGKSPKFFKMGIDYENVYSMKINKI